VRSEAELIVIVVLAREQYNPVRDLHTASTPGQ
jgi:hypothetical protein